MTYLLQRWQDYWFRPTALLNLAVCRILIVGCQLVYNVGFARGHIRQLSGLPDTLYDPLPILHLLILPFGWRARPSFELLALIWVLTFAAGVLALIGLKTKPSLMTFALGNLFLSAFKYSFGEMHHPDAVMAITLPILALSPAGELLSLDDLRRRMAQASTQRAFIPFRLNEEQSSFARWPLVTVRWLFALVFFSAAASKLVTSGLEWMNGYTLQRYLLQDSLRWGTSLGLWLSRYHAPAVIMSWMSMIIEGTFFLALIVPRLAWVYVPAAMGLVLGFYFLMHANFLMYLSLFSVFIPWNALAGTRSWRRPRPAGASSPGRSQADANPRAEAKPEILFDDQCPLCIRSMVVLRYADWCDRLIFSGLNGRWPWVAERYREVSLADCQREMHIIFPDGSIAHGFFAFRRLLLYLPPLWPLLAVFHFPMAGIFGPKIYRWVASRRLRFASCPADGCPIHSPAAVTIEPDRPGNEPPHVIKPSEK